MSSYPITGEIYAAGYRWREEFTTEDLTAANGIDITGTPIIDDGLSVSAGQMLVIENPRQFAGQADGLWGRIEFTPDFAADDGALHYLFESGATNRFRIRKRDTDFLQVMVAGTLLNSVALGVFGPHWRINDRNVLVFKATPGQNQLWLNGTLLSSTATAYAPAVVPDRTYIATDTAGGNIWGGVIHSMHFGHGDLEDEDVVELTQNTVMTAISPSQYLFCMPCDETHVSGANTVTRVVGTAGITEAILGAGAAQPAGPEQRFFDFDGGDNITVASRELLQFTADGADVPFTAFFQFVHNPAAGSRAILTKASAFGVGEWYVFSTPSSGPLIFRIVDNDSGGYIGRRIINMGRFGQVFACVCSYDGSGAVGGLSIYASSGKGIQVDDGNSSAGAFTRMRPTAEDLIFGNGLTNPWSERAGLPGLIRGHAACRMQSLALLHRIERYRNISTF